MNYPNQNNGIQTKKVIRTKDMKISLYDQSKNPPMLTRIFTRKTPHSLDKILKQTNTLNSSSSILKQINEKKLAPNYSLGNILSNTEDDSTNQNNNNSFAQSIINHRRDYSINNNPSYNDIDQSSIQSKEHLIQNLKTNFSQEKIRKKSLFGLNKHMNTDYPLNNNNFSHSFYQKQKKNDYKPLIFTKIDQHLPLKLHLNNNKTKNSFHTNISKLNNNNGNISFNTEVNNSNSIINSNFPSSDPKSMNSQSVSSNKDQGECNSKIFGNGNKLMNTNISQLYSQSVFDLELKMEKMLKDNKTNSKSKKYNVIKYIFEEYIKITTGESQSLLRKLLFSYHDVVSSFSNENKYLKDLSESVQNKYLALDKTLIETTKGLKKKEMEYEVIKKQLIDIKKATPENNGSNNNIISKEGSDASTQHQVSSKEDNNNNNKVTDDNIKLQYLQSLNVKNIEDLDALYFYDKVKMQIDDKATKSIPTLDLTCFDNCNTNTNNKETNQVKVTKKFFQFNKD